MTTELAVHFSMESERPARPEYGVWCMFCLTTVELFYVRGRFICELHLKGGSLERKAW